jgi:predicted unusual protein kinase regulating ubiquinone biosynthesis (AarF/ABC1/UbiB family)
MWCCILASGNLMRTPDGKIVILDFGLMTEVSEDQRIALVEYIAHLTVEDWEGVAGDLVKLGEWVGLHTRSPGWMLQYTAVGVYPVT